MAFWDKLGTSGDVEDRRGSGGLLLGGGIGGLLITAAVLFLSGQSGSEIAQTVLTQALGGTQSSQQAPFEDSKNYKLFAERVLGSTNEYWTSYKKSEGQNYTPPGFVLFRGSTTTGCGAASSSVGPFYCPEDQKIYLDETFFDEIQAQLSANTGDVAQAYVIAHEVGHHVQQLQGTLDTSDSIRTELQADCYAGAWAKSISSVFENKDEVNEALDLAGAIGDDRIQQKTEGQVNPETWTHGSSDQRRAAFSKGYDSGTPQACTL